METSLEKLKVKSEVYYSEQYMDEDLRRSKFYIDENIPSFFLLVLPLEKVKTSVNIPHYFAFF